MFSSSNNLVIHGGTFLSVKGPVKGLDILLGHVAASAFHDSAQRFDVPRCHPKTRTALLQEIFDWILQDAGRTTWLVWLHGAAGAGKTAIAQTIAELCIEKGLLVASFFFLRTDPTRNSLKYLVPTLAFQLAQLIPDTRPAIEQAMESDPLIFQQSFETQFNALIVVPLQRLQSPHWKLLLVVDGIDECDRPESQIQLIRVVNKFLVSRDPRLLVLFGSRAEYQLRHEFDSPKVADILLKIPMDAYYLPDQDIRLFLSDSFAKVKDAHPFSNLLDDNWPAPAALEEIVDKTSGQFIYASVVMKFISSPRSHPAHQLEIVRGLRPSGLATPFAQLDALYRHIFSQISDINQTISFLAYFILGETSEIHDAAVFFDIPPADIYVAFSDLASVVACENGTLHFLHASLPDFLLDQLRSQEYYISPAHHSTTLSILGFQRLAEKKKIDEDAFLNFLRNAEGNPQLRESVFSFDRSGVTSSTFYKRYIAAIQRIDFGDDSHELYGPDIITNEIIVPHLPEEHHVAHIVEVEEINREETEELNHQLTEKEIIKWEEAAPPRPPKRSRLKKLTAWIKKRK